MIKNLTKPFKEIICLPKFERDLKKLLKRFPSLAADLDNFINTQHKLFHKLGIENEGNSACFFLLRRTREIGIGTENATVPFFWPQDDMTIRTLIEKLAEISRHFYFARGLAIRTGQPGSSNNLFHSFFHNPFHLFIITFTWLSAN